MVRHCWRDVSRWSAFTLLFLSLSVSAQAQSNLVGITNLEFNFAARQVGAQPGFASSGGGVALLEHYLGFLGSPDLERDFVPTNVIPAGGSSDSFLNINLAHGKLWVLSANLIGHLPPGARLEVEVEGTRRVVLKQNLETVLWWDRGTNQGLRLNYRLWLNRDAQPSRYSLGVQYSATELP
jgi:hypothetical protein